MRTVCKMIEVYHSHSPVVSVVMPTFNNSKYLGRSISSFLNQSYTDCELIVVDDGSSDDTFHVVNEFIREHNHIRYMKHSNRKPSLSRNAGIKAAAGKYLAFLDSDDEYESDYLEVRVQFMDAHPSVDLIEGTATVIGNEYVKDRYDMSRKIHLSECHIGATFFGKAEVFRTLGGFDKKVYYGEDCAFWEKAERQFRVQRFAHPGYIYYRNIPDSICNTI